MSEFFDVPSPPPEPDPEPEHYRMPPWFGPPEGTLPGVVEVERVLARTDQVAVCVTRFAAYPSGFELDVVTMTADPTLEFDPCLFEGRHLGRSSRASELPPEMLRIGVQFSDGAKATNVEASHHHPHRPPEGPVMHPGGGGGGGSSWHQTLWIWPLPPPGALALVCEWPATGIPTTRTEIDAQLILDAAARAQVVFSDEHLPEWPDDGEGGSPPVARIT